MIAFVVILCDAKVIFFVENARMKAGVLMLKMNYYESDSGSHYNYLF
jgi:hypothetical protein